jgi:hypothetical protein
MADTKKTHRPGRNRRMAIGTIITCTGPEDLFRKAEDLLSHGIHTEFVGRNTMKVVSIQPQGKVSKMNPADAQKSLHIA